LETKNIYSAKAFAFAFASFVCFFCAKWMARLYFISTELFSKQKNILRQR